MTGPQSLIKLSIIIDQT